MIVLGITGGSGSGKTTLLKEIAKRGGFCIDCDALYYSMLKTNSALRGDLIRTFGNVFLADGSLNRPALAAIVFQNEEKLHRLNEIVYRHMGMELENILCHEQAAGTPILGVDAVNLFGADFDRVCDATVAVLADREVRFARIMERDCIPEDYARKRIEAQPEDDYWAEQADYTIRNENMTETEFRQASSELLDRILKNIKEK